MIEKHGLTGRTNAMKADKPRSARVSFRAEEQSVERWKAQADSDGVTLTDLITQLLDQYCADQSTDSK